MKKILVSLSLVITLSSMALSATMSGNGFMGVGARYAGMGGVGVGIVDDICAAYYNPAGLMSSGYLAGEAKLALSAATNDLGQITSALNASTNPAKYLADNMSNKIDLNGNVSGILGVSIRKVGISVIPVASLVINKAANSVAGTANAGGAYALALTLGTTVPIPGMALNIGTNLKYINDVYGNLTTTQVGLTANGTQTLTAGNGMGLDIGVQGKIPIAMVSDLYFGAAVKNLMQTVNYSIISNTIVIDALGNITKGADVNSTSTYNYDPIYAIGCGAKVGPVGTLVGLDMDLGSGTTGSVTHIGVEQWLPLLTLRAGLISGQNIAMTSVGLMTGLLGLPLNLAYVMDNNNSKNTQVAIEFGGGF